MITYSREKNIGTLTLGQNDKNSFSKADFLKLKELLSQIKKEDLTLLVLKSSTPDVFSTGLNLNDLGGNTDETSISEFLNLFYDNLELLYTLPIPTISEVSGHALGYGAMLVLATDYRIANSNIRFGLPEVKIGIRVPSFIYALLGESIGPIKATEHVLLGDAEKAKDISGLFYELAETKEELEKKVKSLVTKLSRNSSEAMKETKKAILFTKTSILQLISMDKAETKRSLNSSHAKEGIEASQVGRRPNFT